MRQSATRKRPPFSRIKFGAIFRDSSLQARLFSHEMITIQRLFISPGHNYFGHHEQPAGENPLVEVSEIECVAGSGIRGDRFFNYKPDYKGQITFFSLEIFEQLRGELNLADPDASKTRRNVLTTGADLKELIGNKFEIQGVSFEGVEECKPCYWMDQALGPGAEQWLKGRGGLRARILSDGMLRVDHGNVLRSSD